jgi:hypothetical protein
LIEGDRIRVRIDTGVITYAPVFMDVTVKLIHEGHALCLADNGRLYSGNADGSGIFCDAYIDAT